MIINPEGQPFSMYHKTLPDSIQHLEVHLFHCINICPAMRSGSRTWLSHWSRSSTEFFREKKWGAMWPKSATCNCLKAGNCTNNTQQSGSLSVSLWCTESWDTTPGMLILFLCTYSGNVYVGIHVYTALYTCPAQYMCTLGHGHHTWARTWFRTQICTPP